MNCVVECTILEAYIVLFHWLQRKIQRNGINDWVILHIIVYLILLEIVVLFQLDVILKYVIFAKQTSLSLNEYKSTHIFSLIHCDFYFLTIVDNYSWATWVYLLQDKIESSKVLISFFAIVKRQFDVEVQKVQSDNGTKF